MSSTRCLRAATRCTSSTTSAKGRPRASRRCGAARGRHPATLTRVFEAVRPETVFHLAAQADVRVSVERPDLDAEVNVLGTLRILEAARRHEARIVFSSTGGAIYGECDGPAAETAERPPACAVRRLEALRRGVPRNLEPALRHRPRLTSVRERLRPAPGAPRRGGRRRNLHGAPARRRHADDLRRRDPDARLRLRRRRRARMLPAAGGDGGVFNIGTGRETSVVELYDAIQRAAGTASPRSSRTAPRRASAKRARRLARRARARLARRALLDDGLAATWRWIEGAT